MCPSLKYTPTTISYSNLLRFIEGNRGDMCICFFGFFFRYNIESLFSTYCSISMLIRILTPYEVGLVLLVRQWGYVEDPSGAGYGTWAIFSDECFHEKGLVFERKISWNLEGFFFNMFHFYDCWKIARGGWPLDIFLPTILAWKLFGQFLQVTP